MGQYQGKSQNKSKIYEKTRFFRNFFNSHPFLNLNLLLVDPATYVMSGKNERTPKNFYQLFLKKNAASEITFYNKFMPLYSNKLKPAL